jgi:membrane protein
MNSPMSASNLSTGEQIKSLWKLGGLGVGQLARRVYKSIDEDNILGRSSELAYNFILSIFPLLLFLISLFGIFASRGTALRSNLLYYLSRVLPPSAFDLMSKTIQEVTKNTGGTKVTIGILLALFSASGGITSMMSALNGAYGVRERRSWFKVRGIALGLTVALAVLVVTALVLVLAGGVAADYLGARLHLGVFAVVSWKVVQLLAALLFVVVAFSLIYYYGPNLEEQHWYWITPGSLVGVLLWLAASIGFRVYLHFFNTYSKTYGSLGAAIILLIWFYVTGLAFLVGGEINSEIENAAAEHGHPEAKAVGEKAPGESDPATKKVA